MKPNDRQYRMDEFKPDIEAFLDMIGIPAPKPVAHPDVEPRDDLGFVAHCARQADFAADAMAKAANCPCKICKLVLPQLTVAHFAIKETIRAAYTGDRTKLDALLAKVEELKAA